MVTFHTTVHDGLVSLLRNTLLGNLGIYPVWKSPHFGVDLPKLDRRACVILNRFFKRRIEVCVVQKHVGVMIPPVEVSLDRLDGLDNAV